MQLAFLSGMTEAVGDILKQAIPHGLPVNWESLGKYLDSAESSAPSINVGSLVGYVDQLNLASKLVAIRVTCA